MASASSLITRANDNGGLDNVGCVLLRWGTTALY